jgi:hypothetical protein
MGINGHAALMGIQVGGFMEMKQPIDGGKCRASFTAA